MISGALDWLHAPLRSDDVGRRARLFSTLRQAGLPVPSGFVLGRPHFDRYARSVRSRARAGFAAPLPADLRQVVADALETLGRPVAVRRSPFRLAAGSSLPVSAPSIDGRPDRETFLHLEEAADVVEAIRRVWLHALAQVPPDPSAVIVQRFVVGEASAIARPHADPELLAVESAHGAGDLLAAGLLSPDRQVLRRATGAVVSQRSGRKAHVSVPHPGGGTTRMQLPVEESLRPALDAAQLAEVARLWREAEGSAATPLASLAVTFAGGEAHVIGIETTPPDDPYAGVLLG